MGGPITYDLSGSVPLTTGRNPEAPQFRLPSSREEQPMVPLTRRDRERQPSRQEVRGAATAGLSHSPRFHSTNANAGLKFNFADGGHVDAALHLLRQHFDEGGFLDSLRGMFSGPDYLSTGEVASPTNWGDPESAADFFKADRALRLAQQAQAPEAPLTAPRPGAVETRELPARQPIASPPPAPTQIPFAAPDRGVTMSGSGPATIASQPLAYTAAPPPARGQAAITAAMPVGAKFANRVADQPNAVDLNRQQADYVARTIAAETSGKSPEEAQAIASVILNRIRSGQYGATPEDVLFAKNQFEPWSNRAGANYPMKISDKSQRYLDAQAALEAAQTGEDITGGATHFWGPKAQFALGRPAPSWGRTGGVDIGETRFHKLERAEGGEIHGDEHMNHDDIVAHALHRLRRHFDGSDGSYVDPADEMPTEPRPLTIYRDNRPKAVELPAESDADRINAYTEMAAQVAQQSPEIQSMTHLGAKPTLPVTLDSGYAKGMELGRAPFDVAPGMSTLANTAYGAKTLPLYMNPVTALPAAASDFTESAMDKSLPGMAMSLLGVPGKIAKYGAGALMGVAGMEPGEAQAAKLPRISGALSEAARAGLSRTAPKVVDPSLERAFDIVRSATADDAGQAVKTAKQIAGPPQRGILATPDLRQIDRDEAIRIARSEPHLIQDANGQYVGAPRGITTPEQIQAMREAFDKDVEAGAVGGDWYERAREFNREISGDNPYRQKLVANEEALWSAQANPDTNLGFGLNARTDYEAGKYGDKYRTGQQARSYGEARRAMDLAKSVEAEKGMMGHNQGPALTDIDVAPSGLSQLGKKTGIYGQHLDPTVPPATTGTNDIWHARGFGYTNQDGGLFSRALSPQEHRFLDYETMLAVDRANANKLAGRSDWTGAEIQAAPWVAGKGRALAQRGNKPLEQGIAEAAQTYPDVAPKYTYSTPIEQIPGANTGLLPNLINADDATKAAFTARADWKDPKGRDALWSELGMPTRYTNDTLGAYRNSIGNVEYNPLEIGRPMSGFGSNEAGNPVANPRMAAGLSMGQAARGLLDFQEGTPWNKFITHGAGPDKTSIHVGIGRNPTRQELDALMELGQKHGLDLTNTEGGVGFINWKKNQTTTSIGKDLRSGLLEEIKSILPDATVQRARFQGDYFDLAKEGVNELSKGNQGKGLATKKLFDSLSELRNKAPDFYNRILDSQSIASKSRANLDRLIESGGQGQRPDYERLLKIVGEDGLRGLLDRVTKLGYRGLPAIGAVGTAGAVLDSSASKDGSEPGRYD
jgi:hypothetical protein